MSWYTLGWALVIGGGLALEAKALHDKRPGDTLSEHVWKWAAVRDRHARWGQARRAALLLGMVWLTAHFVTGGQV